jgi:hypothetical protein
MRDQCTKVRLRFHSRRPRKRSCDSMSCSSSCARSNPARALVGLLVWSLAIRRSAASTRSCARCKSATLYCRGSGRVRLRRAPFDILLATMAAVSCFAVAIGPLRFPERPSQSNIFSAALRARRGNLWVALSRDGHRSSSPLPTLSRRYGSQCLLIEVKRSAMLRRSNSGF